MSDQARERQGTPLEHLFATLIDLLPDYFYVHDLDMRLVYVNKASADYYGLPKDQIVGKRLEELEPNKEHARYFNELGRQIIGSQQPRVTDDIAYPEPD